MNPFKRLIVTVDTPADIEDAVTLVALRVKEGGPTGEVTVSVIVVLAVSAPLVPVTVSE